MIEIVTDGSHPLARLPACSEVPGRAVTITLTLFLQL